MLVLNEMEMDVFNSESLRAYRQRMRLSRPGHVWDTLEDEDFLVKMGAAGNMRLSANTRSTSWTIGKNTTTLIAGRIGSFPPPVTGVGTCSTSSIVYIIGFN